jgi:O-antigen/teichoic acid export membrane protein
VCTFDHSMDVGPKLGEFGRKVVTVAGGTAVAQGILVMSLPILAWFYSTDAFGIQAVFVSLTTIFSIVATGRFEMAIVLPEKDSKATALVSLSVFTTFFLSLLFGLICFWAGKWIEQAIHSPGLNQVILLLPLSIFGTSLFQIFSNWGLRKKAFKLISVARVVQNLLALLFALGFAIGGNKEQGLIWGYALGQLLGGISMAIVSLLWTDFKPNFQSLPELAKLVSDHRRFPGINAVHALADSAFNNGLTFIISILFGSSVVGLYSISYRLLRIPLAFIGASIAQVLFPEFAELSNTQRLEKKDVVQPVRKILWIALPFFAGIAALAPLIISLLLGKEWEEAGTIAQLLCPWLFFNFLFSPLSNLPTVIGKQFPFFLITLVGNLLSLVVLFVSAKVFPSYHWPFFLFSLVCGCMNLYGLLWLINLFKPSHAQPNL